MSDVDRSRLTALAQAATPGPWGVGNGDTIATEVEQVSRGAFRFKQVIAKIDDLDYEDAFVVDDEVDESAVAEQVEADAEFIAACSPDVVLALLAEAAEKDAEIARLLDRELVLQEQAGEMAETIMQLRGEEG